MPIYRLGRDLRFPDPEDAEPDGLLAIGGDLAPERLLEAHAHGIFPWYEDPQPILWHSPDPRMVLRPADLHVPRRLARTLRSGRYALSLDTDFEGVIRHCARVRRRGQRGTWITPAMIEAYCRLHADGYAHSAEARADGELVGGVYGVALGGCFFGESMFALRPDASKTAFVALVRQLETWGFSLLDCQVYTEHVARFGGREWSRRHFLDALATALETPTRRGPWRFDATEPRTR